MKTDNITLVGMAGAGKSKIGKVLAKRFGFHFVDCDKYIEEQENMKLQQIVDTKGDGCFVKIEEKRVLELLPTKKCVIDPGGSIVYSKRLMKALKNSSIIIFLDTPLGIIQKRLQGNAATRGIVGLKSKSIKELYKERVPLYKKYADITINCFGKSDNQIIQEIIKKLTILK